MKFRYYIGDVKKAEWLGTNDQDLAHDLSLSDDFFVIDSELGIWLDGSKEKTEIKEFEA
jgi:hypothetical protein